MLPKYIVLQTFDSSYKSFKKYLVIKQENASNVILLWIYLSFLYIRYITYTSYNNGVTEIG